MNFKEYQEKAITSAIYGLKIIYPTLGLCGEAGEVAEKIKKMIRDDNNILTEERKSAIILELGDCLWYIANLANDLQIDLNEVAEKNLTKLAERRQKKTIKGDGDNR